MQKRKQKQDSRISKGRSRHYRDFESVYEDGVEFISSDESSYNSSRSRSPSRDNGKKRSRSQTHHKNKRKRHRSGSRYKKHSKKKHKQKETRAIENSEKETPSETQDVGENIDAAEYESLSDNNDSDEDVVTIGGEGICENEPNNCDENDVVLIENSSQIDDIAQDINNKHRKAKPVCSDNQRKSDTKKSERKSKVKRHHRAETKENSDGEVESGECTESDPGEVISVSTISSSESEYDTEEEEEKLKKKHTYIAQPEMYDENCPRDTGLDIFLNS